MSHAPTPRERLNQLYAAVAVGKDGAGEEIVTFGHSTGEILPLVATLAGLPALEKHCKNLAKSSGRTVRIFCFTGRTPHETFPASSTTGDDL